MSVIYTSCTCGTGDECGILSVGVSVSVVNFVGFLTTKPYAGIHIIV